MGQQLQSILLVEDDEKASEIIYTMLEMKFPGTRIHRAGNGRNGLDMFRAHLPDLVITDINMPEMDGLHMLYGIQEIRPHASVIVITAHSDRNYLAEISSTGVDVGLVRKPIDFKLLFATILQRSVVMPGYK